MRYTVKPRGRDFIVLEPRQRDFEAVGVWNSNGTIRCCECSGPLVAMSASCRHVQAVKRYMNRPKGKG
jgi:hypothetical protein